MSDRKIEIINPGDKGLPADLMFSALSNKTLAEELRKLAVQCPFGSREFGILMESKERLERYG